MLIHNLGSWGDLDFNQMATVGGHTHILYTYTDWLELILHNSIWIIFEKGTNWGLVEIESLQLLTVIEKIKSKSLDKTAHSFE